MTEGWVFCDPELRRWRRIRWLGRLTGLVVIGAFAVIFIRLVVGVGQLPALLTVAPHDDRPLFSMLDPLGDLVTNPSGRQGTAMAASAETSSSEATRAMTGETSAAVGGGGGGPARDTTTSQVLAFHVNWDPDSFASLKRNLPTIDGLLPEWLHMTAAHGVVLDDPEAQKTVDRYIAAHRPGLIMYPVINNFNPGTGAWDGAGAARLLADPARRASIVTSVVAYVKERAYDGVTVDLEDLPAASERLLPVFLRELRRGLGSDRLKVIVCAPAEGDHDYAGLADAADRLLLMAYDEHTPESDPGPIAARDWFRRSLQHSISDLPREKVIVAIGTYGYDWNAGGGGAPVSYRRALQLSSRGREPIGLDAPSREPHFDYTATSGAQHHVWFLDAVTAFDQVAEASAWKPSGYALWRLGPEDPHVWNVMRCRDSPDAWLAASLDMTVEQQGTGEVVRLQGGSGNGERRIVYDAPSNRIVSETLTAHPDPYRVQHLGGGGEKLVALTFDDGPDPRYTPHVLDILRERNVPATFFVVGERVEAHPELVSQALEEGHEIGNHTLTHPDLNAVSRERIRSELEANEYLLGRQFGIVPKLFRPPFGSVVPETAQQAAPLIEATKRGYYTVGYGVDTNDWLQPGKDAIVERAVKGVESGQHIVLMHDAGGDRVQTVEALPEIIDTLGKKGYRFTTVSGIIGAPALQVVPQISAPTRLLLIGQSLVARVFDQLDGALAWLLRVALILTSARLLLVILLAALQRLRRVPAEAADTDVLVSVLVPAHNEEKVICESLASILASDYPTLEVIVIDDGSEDQTYALACSSYVLDPRVRVLHQENMGKSTALNLGFSEAKGDVVVTMDADTYFRPDAIRLLARHFSDAKVAAVAGNAKVGNRINLLTRWQALEYVVTQNLDRRAFDMAGCITVVPGAVGAWRRSAVVEAGGFLEDTLAEDAELTMRLLKQGWTVRYEDRAVGLTEAPDTVIGLARQRHRWVYGTLQSYWKHRGAAFRPRRGSLGLVAYPNMVLFQILLPLVAPVADGMLLCTAVGAALSPWVRLGTSGRDLVTVLAYWGLFVVLDVIIAWIAFALEGDEDRRLLAGALAQRFFYRQLMYFVLVRSLMTALKGTLVGWNKLERKATVDCVSIGGGGQREFAGSEAMSTFAAAEPARSSEPFL